MRLLFVLIFSLFLWSAYGQESSDEIMESLTPHKVKHLSIGVKAGSPIVLGASAEIVFPILGNHLAGYFDFSDFNDLTVDDVSLDHKFTEFGINIYFSETGKGFYAGLGSSSTVSDFGYEGEVSDNGNTYIGLATGSLDLDLINAKLGIKTGGTVYFRFEVGYAFGDIPEEIEITGTTQVMGTTQTETSFVSIPDVPGLSTNGMLVANIGFGLSF